MKGGGLFLFLMWAIVKQGEHLVLEWASAVLLLITPSFGLMLN